MTIGRRDGMQAAGTVVDARERTWRMRRWWLAAALVLAALALLREPAVVAWFTPGIDALAETVRDFGQAFHQRSVPASGEAATSPRTQSAPGTHARKTAPPVAAKETRAPSNPGADAKPFADGAPATSTAIEPLYPVPPPSQRPAAVPQGRAGLVEALRAGTLRPATAADIARWKSRHASMSGAAPGRDFDDRLRMFEAYVVDGDFVIPDGLDGANAAVFVLEAGVPYPRGDAGHSVVLDLASGACVGLLCRTLLPAR